MGAIVGMYLAVVRIRVFGLNSRTGDRIHATHIFNGFVLPKKGDMKFCTVNNCFICTHMPYPPGIVTH